MYTLCVGSFPSLTDPTEQLSSWHTWAITDLIQGVPVRTTFYTTFYKDFVDLWCAKLLSDRVI